MLSDSTQAGAVGPLWLRRALFARGRRAQLIGLAAGAGLAIVVVGAWLMMAPRLTLGVVGMVPVGVLAWYGGAWWGLAPR